MPYDLKRIPRQVEPAGPDAARLGEELRDARLALGHSVDEMARRLRIRRAHLEALEEGRPRDLPGLAYGVGYVRAYAAALGLDEEETARRFRDAAGAVAAKPKLVFPEPVPERGMPAGAVVAAGLVVAICGYVAWFNWAGGGSRTVDVVPPVPPRLEAAAEQGRNQFPGQSTGREGPGALPLAALPPPGGVGAPASGTNTSAQAATVPAAPTPPPAPAATPAPAAVAAIPGVPDGTRIVLRARAGVPDGAWVQVRDSRSGQALVNRVLRPGEVYAVPVRDGLLLDTGNAGGLEVLVDGQPQPTFEGLVGVRRNVPLDPERLRQRLVPATAAAPAQPRN